MSEQVTHLGIADDARRLACASPRICEPIKTVLREHVGEMRLGAVTRASELFAGPILIDLAARRDAPEPADGRKLAFCLGTLAHRAADRMMKPIFKAQSADGACEPKDISIYHDAFVFRHVYASGRTEPYRPDMFDPAVRAGLPGSVDAGAFESAYRVLFQRALLAAHTFKPDLEDPEGWLERVFKQLQDFTIDLGRYHKALTDPDEEIRRRAVEDVNFYNESDRILALAADLRDGKDITGDEFLRRCYLGDGDSLYARALSASYGYIQVAGEYWQGRLDETLLRDALKR